jgi:colanic acid/amylovoran biosynthesis glycosyltransferase
VSVIVPFGDNPEGANEVISTLSGLPRLPGDELLLVDNTEAGMDASAPGISVIRADGMRSSYYARNVGGEHAATDWLLFIDSDCLPSQDLLARYFESPIPQRSGIVAGEVGSSGSQGSLAARHARSRGHLAVEPHLSKGPYPAGVTANLLVRRAAWEALGGFCEVRSGADLEFCWRAQELGWDLDYRPAARVEHRHADRIPQMLRKAARYGPGQLWLGRRFRGAVPRPRLMRELARAVGGAIVWPLTGQFERGAFKALDGLWWFAYSLGYYLGRNGPVGDVGHGGRPLGVALDAFPAPSESFVAGELRELRGLGWGPRIVSTARPRRIDRAATREFGTRYAEDDPPSRKALCLTWLLLRHPLRCARDRVAQRRWSRAEAVTPLSTLAPVAWRLRRDGLHHVHVHFAAWAALDQMRAGRLLGTSYSVTTHGYDIYRQPANLREKLESAAFAVATCEYTLSDLRRLVGANHQARLHKVIMGVDPERFRRRRPHPGGGTVVSVGRYVEKKGYEYLLRATALLRDDPRIERVVIAGDGPLRDPLEALARELGVDDLVRFPRVATPDAVVEVLEGADLFAMPCVVAADGDRDSMPVAVKEALAMEVPVVGSDEVGMPEMVRPEWGVLVPPRDPGRLAEAIAGVMALPPERRAAMGEVGREFVISECTVHAQAASMSRLLEAASDDQGSVAD